MTAEATGEISSVGEVAILFAIHDLERGVVERLAEGEKMERLESRIIGCRVVHNAGDDVRLEDQLNQL